jgi:hypothetical protein
MGHDYEHAGDEAQTYIPGADPAADAEQAAFNAEMNAAEEEENAAELAMQLDTLISNVLDKVLHVGCSLEDYATTTLCQSAPYEGQTVVVCGCGEYFPIPEELQQSRVVALSPEQVDAHGPAAVTVAAADPIARTLELIGPAEDYRPDQVERLMLDAVRRLEEGQAFERWALEEASAARSKYDRAYALEFTKASGAMELRRNVAEVECSALADLRDQTDMVYRAAKAAMHNLRSTLSGYQSVLKSVQATYQAGGSSGGRAF